MTALLSILALGFFLGMRHATDSDHVIAVSTIVSRERDVRHAAIIGMFWGVGHSITLLVVGGAIVVFGLVIPQRLGLSLEFCVALMLIVLGAFNLRIAVRSVRGRSTFIEHEHHEHPHRHGDYIHSHSHGHAVDTHGHSEESVPPARLDRRFGGSRTYRALRPTIIGVAYRSGGFGCHRIAGVADHSRPAVGIYVFVRLWRGHHSRHDVDHDSHCRPLRLQRASNFCIATSAQLPV
jgi:high-affinity nickel-transport protein